MVSFSDFYFRSKLVPCGFCQSSKQAMAQEEVNVPDLPPPPSYQDAHQSQYMGSSSSAPEVHTPTHQYFSSAPVPVNNPSQTYPATSSCTTTLGPMQHHYTIAETPRQQEQPYYPRDSDVKLEFNNASEFYPPGPAAATDFRRQSLMNAYPPMTSPIGSRRDSQYSTYKPQDVYGDNFNRMSSVPEHGTQMPMHTMSPTITTSEPKATMPMIADIKNVLQKPKFPNGERDWSYGMCSCCCENFGTCTCLYYDNFSPTSSHGYVNSLLRFLVPLHFICEAAISRFVP